MHDKEIAEEIWRQMRALDQNLCWCMGVKKLVVIKQGLSFEVSGLSFKGRVEVDLTPADLYKVRLVKKFRTRDEEIFKRYGKTVYCQGEKILDETDGLYFEDLMPHLESKVENRSKNA